LDPERGGNRGSEIFAGERIHKNRSEPASTS
jgi:hypothetical protein